MEVDVYRNLHKNVWSVRNRATGRVRQYADKFVVRNAKFVVQPAGRKKVLKEQRKNVHAFVRGIVTNTGGLHRESVIRRCFKKVTYDPYTMETFQDISGNLIVEAKEVLITNGVVQI